MAWVKNGTPNTLTVAGDDLDITDLTAKTWNQSLVHTFGDSPTVTSLDHRYTLDNNANTDYARRTSTNGGADTTATSASYILTANNDTDQFEIGEWCNISGEEKLGIIFTIESSVAGAGTAPTRRENVAKVDTTTNSGQFTRIDLNNSVASVSFDIGSNISVLGEEGDEVIWDRTLEQANTEFIATDTGNSLMHDGTDFTIGGWKELGRAKLGADNDNINVKNLPNKRYYMLLLDTQPNGTCQPRLRLNEDTGTNYADRRSVNGAADATRTSQTHGLLATLNTGVPQFSVGFIANLTNKEKLSIVHWNQQNTAGATNPPQRAELVNKWTNTTDSINTITAWDGGETGTFGVDSEMVILGYDPEDIHSKGFWEELGSADLSGGAADDLDITSFTAKKYLWVQMFIEPSGQVDVNMTFNNDSGSNYARRQSYNGAADGTSTSDSNIPLSTNVTTPIFYNFFIINTAANEKLVIHHEVRQSTAGAGTAPDREEQVIKWANTSNQITRIDVNNPDSGSYGTNSFIKVWGSD